MEWDEAKNQANIKKHGISFELAKRGATTRTPSNIMILSIRPSMSKDIYVLEMLADFSSFSSYTKTGKEISG